VVPAQAQERTGGANIRKPTIFLPENHASHIRTDEIITFLGRDKNFDGFLGYRKSNYSYLAQCQLCSVLDIVISLD
jgi:hypothetical protein